MSNFECIMKMIYYGTFSSIAIYNDNLQNCSGSWAELNMM